MQQKTTLFHNDKILTGTPRELAMVLRQPPYRFAMSKIGKLLGMTRQNVSLMLQGTPYGGPLEYPELEDLKFFEGKTDEEMAGALGVGVTRVKLARQALQIPPFNHPPQVSRRLHYLAQSIFGKNYVAGPKFEEFITPYIMDENILNGRLQELMINFYLKGMTETATSRSYRYDGRNKLSEAIMPNVSLPHLIDTGVLKEV